MRLEVGKFYKTRSGRKAYVTGRDLFYPGTNDFIGAIRQVDYSYPAIWSESGLYRCSEGAHPANDIVSEWKEPLEGEAWAVVDINHQVVRIYIREKGMYFDPDHDQRVVKISYKENI